MLRPRRLAVAVALVLSVGLLAGYDSAMKQAGPASHSGTSRAPRTPTATATSAASVGHTLGPPERTQAKGRKPAPAPAKRVVSTTAPTASRTASPVVPSECPTPADSVITVAPGAGKTVALTFDDGAGPAMLAIANILRSKGVTATFFDTGRHDSADPATVRTVASMGFLIANHTWDHNYPSQTPAGWTVAYLRDQMARTSALQQRLTGHPACFFRPPGGYLTNVLAAASAEGLSTVRWSLDARDWAQPGHDDQASVAKIVETATSLDSDYRQHPIILMHAAKASHEPDSEVSSYRGNTIAALPQIVDWYATHGYRFVNLLGQSAAPRVDTAKPRGGRP